MTLSAVNMDNQPNGNKKSQTYIKKEDNYISTNAQREKTTVNTSRNPSYINTSQEKNIIKPVTSNTYVEKRKK